MRLIQIHDYEFMEEEFYRGHNNNHHFRLKDMSHTATLYLGTIFNIKASKTLGKELYSQIDTT